MIKEALLFCLFFWLGVISFTSLSYDAIHTGVFTLDHVFVAALLILSVMCCVKSYNIMTGEFA